jgi:hypothetical protein
LRLTNSFVLFIELMMSNWKKKLKADPTDWLMAGEDPSIRYFLLTDLLGYNKRNPDVRQAQKDIMTNGAVSKILAKRNKNGYWGKPEQFYSYSKYKGTVWTLLLLAQIGADGRDDRIKQSCEFILNRSQDKDSGGFAFQGNPKGSAYHEKVIPCLTGNMLYCLIRFGYLDDKRIKAGINWITKYSRYDDSDSSAPADWPYAKFANCWGKHTCFMGIVKNLKALAEIPKSKRTSAVKRTIEMSAEYMLRHHLYRRSHNLKKVAIKEWLRFSYPLMWNDDTLEVLDILLKLGYRDKRMDEAINLVLSKQDKMGRWKMDFSFNGRMLTRIEEAGKASRWITYRALKVLNLYYGQ